MDVFIGIDPSLNSTGLAFLYYENKEQVKEYYVIVKPNKLTKKEKEASEKYLYFDYVLYEKEDLKGYENNNHKHEKYKTLNFIRSLEKIIDTIRDNVSDSDNIHVVQEGISYGSTLRTKSVFDLAGFNYMLRYKLYKFCKDRNAELIIATPTEIKKYATGAGNCKKEAMVNVFKIFHPDFDLPKIDDIVDASFMASYARFLNMSERLIDE
jgi:Holliday junction resolvasome RuvABC endonuclease subunit